MGRGQRGVMRSRPVPPPFDSPARQNGSTSSAELEELWADYLETGSCNKAGERHGMSGTTAWRRLKKAGYAVRATTGPKPSVSTEELRATYEKTKSIIKTGQIHQLDHSVVYRRLAAAGDIVFDGHRRFNDDQKAIILSEYPAHRDGRDGLTVDDLAVRLDCTAEELWTQAQMLDLTDNRAPKLRKRKWLEGGPNSYTDAECRELMKKFALSGLSIGEFCEREGLSRSPFMRAMKARQRQKYDEVVRVGWSADGVENECGTNFEFFVMDEIEKTAGALYKQDGLLISRAKRSKGPSDINVVAEGNRYLIQAKLSDSSFETKDWNRLIDAAEKHHSLPIFADRAADQTVRYWLLTGRRDATHYFRNEDRAAVTFTADGLFVPLHEEDEPRFQAAVERWRASIAQWAS